MLHQRLYESKVVSKVVLIKGYMNQRLKSNCIKVYQSLYQRYQSSIKGVSKFVSKVSKVYQSLYQRYQSCIKGVSKFVSKVSKVGSKVYQSLYQSCRKSRAKGYAPKVVSKQSNSKVAPNSGVTTG